VGIESAATARIDERITDGGTQARKALHRRSPSLPVDPLERIDNPELT